MKMNVAAYLRVSTSDQHPDNQLPAIRAWCESRNYDLVEIYQENESAWKSGHQHELARLLNDLRRGRRRYEYLVVWSLDRLSRQGVAAILHLINTFELYDCKVVSISESWTMVDGPSRELFIAVTGWVAKFESDRRSERTKAGLVKARANGKSLGRPIGKKDSKKRRKKRSVVYLYSEPSVNVNAK
jgi:DNA invertase Pin-like site-specific DNA recombinase